MENTEDFSLEKQSSPKAHLMVVTGRLVPALLQFYGIDDTIFFPHLSASGKRLPYAAFFPPLCFTILVPFCKTLLGFKKTIAKLQL